MRSSSPPSGEPEAVDAAPRRLGFASPPPGLGSSGMTSLVDILLSTTGVFVIVFALQEISDPVERVPAPYDGLIACNETGAYVAYDLRGGDARLPESRMAEALRAFAPDGGRFLVAIGPGCAEARAAGGGSASFLAWSLADQADQARAEVDDAIYLFEIAPIDAAAHSLAALLSRMAGGGE